MRKNYNVELDAQGTNLKQGISSLPGFLKKICLENNMFLDSPTCVGLDITDVCNASCPHCFKNKAIGKTLIKEDYAELIVELLENDVFEIYITGGEPMLRPDIVSFLVESFKSNQNTKLELLTNGTILPHKILQLFKDTLTRKTNDAVQVSLDGTNAKMHEFQRPGALFELVVKNISKLVRNDVPCRINVTVTKHNYKELQSIYKYAADLEVDSINFSPLFPVDNAVKHLQTDMKSLLIEFAKAYQMYLDTNGPLICFDPLPTMIYCMEFAPRFLERFKQFKYIHHCPAASTICEIDHIGNVYPCYFLHLNEICAGNIREKPFINIWRNSYNWNGLRDRLNGLKTGFCGSCQYLTYCRGGCPATAFRSSGTFASPDSRCCWSE